MNKQAISVTLEADNLAWVRGRAMAAGRLSVSEMLDRIIRAARTSGAGGSSAATSVVGTIAIAPDDALLLTADDAIRTLLTHSVRRSAREVARARPAGRRG